MPSDGRSLLSRDPIPFRVAGVDFHVPYAPAAQWIGHLRRPGSLAGALMGAPARERLADVIVDAPEALEELKAESLRVLGVAGGRKWWEVARLLNTSQSPEVLGRMVLAGADPWARSVGEWTAATYALCVKGADDKARLKFDFSLSIPPAEFEDEWDDGGEDAEATQAAVNAMMGL